MEQDKVFGIVKEISLSHISLMTRDDREITYEIREPWKQFIQFIKIYDEVFVETPKSSRIVDTNSLLVIEPRYLVSVTETIKAISCPRKVYVRHMGASASYDPMLHQMQVKGNLLHDVFTNKLVHQNSVQEAIDHTIEQNKMDLILADFDEQAAKNYLNSDAMVLKSFPIQGESEVDIKHYGHGLIGKLDALTTSNMVVELKSSRIPDAHPHPNHNIQMNIYQKMVSDYLNETPKGKVLYVSDGKFGLRDPTQWDHKTTIIARNYTYLVLTGKYLPPVLRGEAKKACRSCYREEGCMSLCAGMVQQRDCDNCYHDNICSKQNWDEVKIDFYQSHVKSTIYEEDEVKTQEYFGHRSSFNSGSSIDTIIASKVDEVVDTRGHFIAEYQITTNDTSFRKGDFVTIYPINHKNEVEKSYNGILLEIENNTLALQTSNSLPSKVEIFPSTTSTLLRRNRENLYKAVTSPSSLAQLMIRLLESGTGDRETLPSLIDDEPILSKPLLSYNDKQHKSIQLALQTPDFLLIQGPAGTGKTSVIIEIINQLVQNGKSILVSAFTNMAVDNVGLKLDQVKIPFIRLGPKTSSSEELHPYTIENNTRGFKEFTKNREGKVILSTTTTIGKSIFDDLFFDYVIIDEASQMTVVNTLMPILHGEKVIMVGDHAQLPPIVISDDAIDLGYNKSLFEKLTDIKSRFIMLEEQYRMSDQILDFPNRMFYRGKLRSASREIAMQQLEYQSELIEKQSYQLITLEDVNHPITSQTNYHEAMITTQLVYELVNKGQVSIEDIGIITPFRAQVALLRKILPRIKIDTIDRYQGSEAEIIIFSTVTMADIPLLSDERRLNVALTRAKRKLIVLQTNPSQTRQKTLLRELYKDSFRRGYFKQLDEDQIKAYKKRIEKFSEEISIFEEKFDRQDVQSSGDIIIFYNSIALLPITLESKERCLICYQMTRRGVQCPGCGYIYHEQPLITWAQENQKCPTCKHRLHVVEV